MKKRTDLVMQWRREQCGYWFEGLDGSLPFHVTEEAFLLCVQALLHAQGICKPTLAQVLHVMKTCRRVDFWRKS